MLSDNPRAIELLEKYPHKICWLTLSLNPNAIHILKDNTEKINWRELSRNPNAMELLRSNKDKIVWKMLCQNPNASELLEEQPDKHTTNLLGNPGCFELDYGALKERIQSFVEELMMVCFHPSRFERYLKTYGYDIGDDEYYDFGDDSI